MGFSLFAIRIKDASNGVIASMAAPPGGSINHGKLEKMVEKYAKIMEVLISKLPNHVGAKFQSLYPRSMDPAFPSIRLCHFRQNRKWKIQHGGRQKRKY
jgi:hypothetical protein